ncbi:MAG: AAA family ATPase [Balneolales bacterium]
MKSFLGNPDNLPDEAGEVEIRQTHGSVLALTEDHVYKVKKPIDFGFMDFTTLEKRHENCQREIKLNRRLCERIYLDVITITEDQDGTWRFGNGKGKVIDYAVRMKRLEDGYFLRELLDKGADSMEMVHVIADSLTSFYQQQKPSEHISKYGNIRHIRECCEGNFQVMEEFAEDIVEPLAFNIIKAFTFGFLEKHQSLFEGRIQQEKIRECHGDLHIDHIHYQNGRLCIYDGIEFNEAFRDIDIANDLAFLAMDFDHNGYIRESTHFTTLMVKKLDDPELRPLMLFYKVYRACVRGKVHGIAGMDDSLSEKDRKNNLDMAKSFFKLALQYACCGSEPSVLVMFGPAGGGKSTLAQSVALLLDCPYLNSDLFRKQLFNLAADEPTPDSLKPSVYSSEITNQVYNALIEKGLEYSKKYPNIILDATYFDPDRRGETRLAFLSAAVKPLFIFVTARHEIIRQRLASRNKDGKAVSDAREKDFDKLVTEYPDPNPGNYQGNLIEIDNSGSLNEIKEKLLTLLTDRVLGSQEI